MSESLSWGQPASPHAISKAPICSPAPADDAIYSYHVWTLHGRQWHITILRYDVWVAFCKLCGFHQAWSMQLAMPIPVSVTGSVIKNILILSTLNILTSLCSDSKHNRARTAFSILVSLDSGPKVPLEELSRVGPSQERQRICVYHAFCAWPMLRR